MGREKVMVQAMRMAIGLPERRVVAIPLGLQSMMARCVCRR